MKGRGLCSRCHTRRAIEGTAHCQKCRDREQWQHDPEYRRNRIQVLNEETFCWVCGEIPSDPTVDHVVRRSEGGSNRRENLRLACRRCNSSRK